MEKLTRRDFIINAAFYLAGGVSTVVGWRLGGGDFTLTRPDPGSCNPNLGRNNFQPVDVSGLLRDSDRVFLTTANTDGALASNFVRSVALSTKAQDARGLWLGFGEPASEAVGFLQMAPRQGVEICGPIGRERIQGRINDIIQHPTSGLVFAAADRFINQTDRFGVYILDPKQPENGWVQYLEPDGLPADQTYGLAIDGGKVLAATWGGVGIWNRRRWTSRDDLMPSQGIRRIPTHTILVTDTDYWLGFIHEGIFRVSRSDPSDRQLFTKENTPELGTNSIRDLQVDPEGRVWAAGDPGVYNFTDKWKREIFPDSGVDKEAMAVRFNHGRPWVASDGGIWFKGDGGWKNYSDRKAYDLVFAPAGFLHRNELVAAATEFGLLLGKVP